MRFHIRKVIQGSLFFGFILLLNVYIPLLYTNDVNSNGQSHPRFSNSSEVLLKGKSSDAYDGRNGGLQNQLSLSHDSNQIDLNVKKNNQLNRKQSEKNGVNLKQSRISPTAGSVGNKNDDDYEFDVNSDVRKTELSDIFISVKTTKKFHQSRLNILLDTWVALARDETYFFTDAQDEEFHNKTKGRLINTNCSAQHNRVSLCCKMSVEFDFYIASNKRWFCHVDDDTYVNVPELSRLLQKYNHTGDWYLGKPSLNHPIEINDPDSPGQRTAFWFATGGAGMCISRSLALKMMPYAAGGKLKTQCARIRLPDDCTIGYIIYNLLHKELTVVRQFHSHLEGLRLIKSQDLDKQITLSYNIEHRNTVQVPSISDQDDPSRLHSWLSTNLHPVPHMLYLLIRSGTLKGLPLGL